MSQKHVEMIVGKLATDEDFRRQFRSDPARAVSELTARGLELTPSEMSSLLATDAGIFDSIAEALDPRLQKASLKTCSIRVPCCRRRS